MAALAPGILLKLIDGMNTGIKPTGEHRSALLQVTDIVPVDLDEKDLWPKHGFYIKISDSSHTLYASLPLEQDDLVLTNKIKLGQYIYVDKLQPGSPVPVIQGARPLPGRHPLVGTPEPITRFKNNGEKVDNSKSPFHRRGSWGTNLNAVEPVYSPLVVKAIPFDSEQSTPIKERNSSMRIGNIQNSPSIRGRLGMGGNSSGVDPRCSVNGLLPTMADLRGESPIAVRKSCIAPLSASRIPRSKSVCERDQRVPRTPINTSVGKKSTTPPPRLRNARVGVSFNNSKDAANTSMSIITQRLKSHSDKTTSKSSAAEVTPVNPTAKSSTVKVKALPGKLSIIGKEILQQRETTQKIAVQALREASASETLVRLLKMFTELSKCANLEDPASCFDQFLGFHQEVVQAVTDMESIQAATSITCQSPKEDTENDSSILHEVEQNSMKQSTHCGLNRRSALSKSVSVALDKQRQIENQRVPDELKKTASGTSTFSNAIKLAKEVEVVAGNWFMEFLEETLEAGLKKKKGSTGGDPRKMSSTFPQSLILKIINWVEVEQNDPRKRPPHPRAANLARKLRIKVKNH
ncbi:uncharacterized protein [Aristolochia californica]|uniref:uncharacterized protein isoform X2 n=1 Tax=Aristolochia californica TaxID=171875 RepID=UPI0035D8CB89